MNIDTLKSAWCRSIAVDADDAAIKRFAREARHVALSGARAARWRVVFASVAMGLVLAGLIALQFLPSVWLGMRLALAMWAASLLACSIRTWCIRPWSDTPADMSLDAYLQACLDRLRREIAYHQGLRWWFWLPFGIGVEVAVIQRLSSTPDAGWLVPLIVLIFTAWGFRHGPRVWPRRLAPEVERLQGLLERATGSAAVSR